MSGESQNALVQIRTTDEEKELYRRAQKRLGYRSLSEFIRQAAKEKADEILIKKRG